MKLSKVRSKLAAAFEDSAVAGMVAAQARADYYQRWMEITAAEGKPCASPAEIDYSIPQISIEAQLCDPMKLRMVLSGHADRFVAQLTDAEKVVWFAEDSEGHSYAKDMANRSVARDALGVLNPRRRKNINKKS